MEAEREEGHQHEWQQQHRTVFHCFIYSVEGGRAP
jgi:hypothetical protein